MLKYLLFLFLAALTFVSCKKEKADTINYFMMAGIDGVKQEFSMNVGAFPIDGSPHGIVVIGRSGNPGDVAPSFSVSLNVSAPLQAKTYMAGVDTIVGGYWYSYANTLRYQSSNDFSITITSITETEIKGSFSGKVEDAVGDIIDITEGIFFAKIQ